MKEVMPYKIGLISTHGVGKSTLVYALAGELKKRSYTVEVITEVAGALNKQGYPINEETNLSAQFSILLHQILKEIEPTAKKYKCDVLISERTVNTDNLVYMERACGPHPFIGHINEFMRHYSSFFPYSGLYLLPLVGELQEDKIRSTNLEFQTDIYNRLKRFLQEQKIEFTELPMPKENDEFREEWRDIILKKTLADLKERGILRWMKKD